MKRTLTLAVALLLSLASSELASEANSHFYENSWFAFRYNYALDLNYGSNFNTWKNANNSDVFHASYDLYMKGHGKYGFELGFLDLFKVGFGMNFVDLHLVPYRQAVGFVNPTAILFNGEPFDMGAHASYVLNFGELSTTYSVAAPVFDKSIVDYIISLITGAAQPKPMPEPSGPITPSDPATGNQTFNETIPSQNPSNVNQTFNETIPSQNPQTFNETNSTANSSTPQLKQMPGPPPDFPTEPTSGSSQGLFPTTREDWTSSMGVFTDPYVGFSAITFDPNGEWTGKHNYWEYSIFGTIKLDSLTPSNDLPPPPPMV